MPTAGISVSCLSSSDAVFPPLPSSSRSVGFSTASLSSADGQPTNKSTVKTVVKIIVMAFDKENSIFFDMEYPLHKGTIEKV